MAGKRTNTRAMHKLRLTFLEEGKAQSKSPDPESQAKALCWLCKEPINYDVEPHTTPDSHNLDHYKSVKDFPEMQDDPSNFRHSHMLCNLNRGSNTPSLGLGEQVPDWWG